MRDLHQSVYENHRRFLDFGDKGSEARIVAFSGVPGSGKSELTKRLAEQYGYVRIANKDIRESITALGLEDIVVVGDYTLWLLNSIASQKPYNIVFDRNIDQWYEPLVRWSSEYDYRLIVIGLEAGRQILDNRLIQREGSDGAPVFDVTEFYDKEHTRVHERISRDVAFRDNYDLDEAAKSIAFL